MGLRAPVTRVAAFLLCVAALVACEREQRRFSEIAPTAAAPTSAKLASRPPSLPPVAMPLASPYAGNAWAVSEGKRLFQDFNCDGCHSQGGGGMGAPLTGRRWIDGGDPQTVYATIVQGRPNGMPAYGGKIPQQQLWQLVAYVQALSGGLRFDARPSRDDHMEARESEQARRHGE